MEVMPTSAVAWSHKVLDGFLTKDHLAVDLTAGNGKDTIFLARRVGRVLAMDIQQAAIHKTEALLEKENIKNAELICDSHEHLSRYVEIPQVDAFVVNLGYLPGGDKNITTTWPATKRTLNEILASMKTDAFISLAIYPGHEEGKTESDGIEDLIGALDQKVYKVVKITFPNQNHCPPYWVGIARC